MWGSMARDGAAAADTQTMTYRPDGSTRAVGDYFPPELRALLATATREVREHVDDHGLCAICACAWPCERAHLADAALAGL
jgi:hypothetical protein